MKPSIFSKEYEKKMKLRKKRLKTFFTLIICVGIVALIIYTIKPDLKNGIALSKKFNIGNILHTSKQDNTNMKDNKKEADKPAASVDKSSANDQKENEEKGYDITLEDGQKIKAVYEIKNNVKTYKYISPTENTTNYNISPSGKSIVIYNDKYQSMTYVDIDGKIKSISNSQYISTAGDVYKRDEYLSAKPNYTWCNSPKFIDDDNVIYVSSLPWLDDRTTKYLWLCSVKSSDHRMITGIEGDNITINNVTDKGIQVIIGDKTMYVSSGGGVSE